MLKHAFLQKILRLRIMIKFATKIPSMRSDCTLNDLPRNRSCLYTTIPRRDKVLEPNGTILIKYLDTTAFKHQPVITVR
jgi:hypothetical protein